MGREKYFKLPKPETNPRGVEITKEALSTLIKEKGTDVIEIHWHWTRIEYDPFKRWVGLLEGGLK